MQQLEQQVNLYYRPSKPKMELLTFKSAMLLVVVGFGVMMLLQTYSIYRFKQDEARYSDSQLKLTQLKKQLEGIKGKAKPTENKLLKTRLNNLSASIKNNKQVFARLQSILQQNSVFVAEYLEGLARTTPDGIWLTSVVADAAGNIEMQGNAVSPPQVPMFIQALAAADAFQGLTFESINVARDKNRNLISFTVSTGGLDQGGQ